MTEPTAIPMPGHSPEPLTVDGIALIQDLLDRNQRGANDIFDSTCMDMPFRSNSVLVEPKGAGNTWYTIFWRHFCCIGIAKAAPTMTSGQPPLRNIVVHLKEGSHATEARDEVNLFVTDFLLLYRDKAAAAADALLTPEQQATAA